jgi:hypothetical protein
MIPWNIPLINSLNRPYTGVHIQCTREPPCLCIDGTARERRARVAGRGGARAWAGAPQPVLRVVAPLVGLGLGGVVG